MSRSEQFVVDTYFSARNYYFNHRQMVLVSQSLCSPPFSVTDHRLDEFFIHISPAGCRSTLQNDNRRLYFDQNNLKISHFRRWYDVWPDRNRNVTAIQIVPENTIPAECSSYDYKVKTYNELPLVEGISDHAPIPELCRHFTKYTVQRPDEKLIEYEARMIRAALRIFEYTERQPIKLPPNCEHLAKM